MAFLYEKPASSAESLLSEGDPESALPQPEPLGSSVALSQTPAHKWWWRKKWSTPVSGGNKSPPRVPAKGALTTSKDKPIPSSTNGSTPGTFLDARLGFILILLLVIAMVTLIAVQFKDSELILAIFTALALFSLGAVYYSHCCHGTLTWFSRKVKSGSGEFSPLVLPASGASTSSPSESPISCGPSSSEKLPPSNSKHHRRDWSLPAMPSVAWLSHRRNTGGSSQVSNGSASPQQVLSPSSSFVPLSAPRASIASLPIKLQIEFNPEDTVGARVEHLRSALELVSSASHDSVWMYESRLADAITCALSSCTSTSLLFQVKQAMDRELRVQNVNEKCANLHTAVFHFLQKGERDAVLTHLSAVHNLVESDSLLKDSQGVKRRLLVSDIDDTLVPTFKDRRGFSWGVPYPGIRQLYKELVLGADQQDREQDLRERVAFVTARPGILRNWTTQEVAKAGFGGSLILMGFASTATSPQGMLAQKVKQVRELKSLWPECSVILVGDNGQRDIDLGALLLKEQLAEAVFIHDIFASEDEFTRTASASLGGELDSTSFAPRPLLPHTTSSDSLRKDECEGEDDDEDAERLLRIPEEQRLAALQPRPMSRLISAPAALGSGGPSSPSSANLSFEGSSPSKRLVVLEPSVPIGFRHEECSRAGIDLFQTYAGAGLKCFQKGLIDADALERVARACASDLGSTSIDGAVKQRLVDGLLRDVARIALEFHHKSSSEKVDFLEFIHEAIKNGNQQTQQPQGTAQQL